MKYNSIFLLLVCLTHNLIAQNIQGRVVYEQNYHDSTLIATFNDPATPPELRDHAQNTIKMYKEMSKSFQLEFSNREALYSVIKGIGIQESSRQQNPFDSDEYYRNYTTNLSMSVIDLHGRKFIVKDTIETYAWQLSDKKKVICGYECLKAFFVSTDTIKSPKQNSNGSIVLEKKVHHNYTNVWFTPDIPVNMGPLTMWGLPGLILEVEFETIGPDLNIRATEININPDKPIQIKVPSKGIVVEGRKGFERAFRKIMNENRR